MDLNAHQRYLIEEFADEYHERTLSRRDLLKRVLLITGSIPFTASVLTTLGCGSDSRSKDTATAGPTRTTLGSTEGATTATGTPTTGAGTPVALTTPGVPANDPALVATDVRFPGPASDVLGYFARPSAAGAHPGVLVIHENRGLNDQIRDVSRRYAKEGFAAFAIDLLSRNGGSARTDANTAPGLLGSAKVEDLVADLLAGLAWMKTQSAVRVDALGVTGFCFGGGYAWETIAASPDVRAGVPYYGSARGPLEKLSQTHAAVLAIYGGNDTRITGEAPQVEERLKASGRPYQIKIYPGAGHAFFNDTGASYNAAAAADAWRETLAWFRRYLT